MHSVPTPHAACARSCTAAPRKVAARRLLARLHQEQTLSSRISSARRSPGFRRRVRALYGVAERSPAWASVGAHQWPGRSAASGITVIARLHQEQTLSSRISSARRSPGFRRRVRALYGVAERSPAWASVGAHQWPGRSAASGITVIDVRSAQTHSRWAHDPATDFVELLVGATRADTSGLARNRSCWHATCQRTIMCKRNRCFNVELVENYG